ncbi:MAG: hypothetical protein JXB05_18515 [Myxococcaceae bacterium]|nr:hypothetical protein [Myxococcaceae bacterium]
MLTAPKLDTAFNAPRREAPHLELVPPLARELPSTSEPPRPKPPMEDDFDSMWEEGLVASW